MGTPALQDALVAGGYLAAGYNSIHIDDCWMETDPPRNSQGQLQVGDASPRVRLGIVVRRRRFVLGYLQACSLKPPRNLCWRFVVHQGDATRFPSGMKALGDYMHSKGVQYALYTAENTGAPAHS